ncbi:DNase I-like protein [Periconia macrospinosa]|uniref:DNase I-like protein n=1 Tax=Periconia macrospinosa TaxID=97972 RepID=A0A2V1E428_9PLEO|nr:DNase I-like protein [Periconia macrospinosa]
MIREISPPPVKRRRIHHEAVQAEPVAPAPPAPPPPAFEASSTTCMRVFSWNINGISPFLQQPITNYFSKPKSNASIDDNRTPAPASLRAFLHRHSWPAVLFLQEVKISSQDFKTQDAVRSASNENLSSEESAAAKGPAYKAYFTLPQDPHNARGLRGNGKVYGVCSIIRSDILTRFETKVRTVDRDKEGRVSVVELIGASSKFAIFNIYAVNGTENPYRSSKGAILGTRHDRKLAFHRLLMEECIKLEKEGWHTLLMGDMNVAPDARDGYPTLRMFPHQHALNRADFNARFLGGTANDVEARFDGIDVWRKIHGDQRGYTYYPRGRPWGSSCDRVDYAIVGRKSWDEGYVKDAGILDNEYERGPSDHVPIWIDIYLEPNSK